MNRTVGVCRPKAASNGGRGYMRMSLVLSGLVVCCVVGNSFGELTRTAEQMLFDSEEPYLRRSYAYDVDTDASGNVHVVYAAPVVGEDRDIVYYATGTIGSMTSQVLDSEGKHGSVTCYVKVDKTTGKVHICYVTGANDPATQLSYRTVVGGVVGSAIKVEAGGWHTFMQLDENGRAIFIREGETNLRLFSPVTDTTWSESDINLTASSYYRLANFVYDTSSQKYHLAYGAASSKSSYHIFRYAQSADGVTWSDYLVDNSETLYELEFWTSLVVAPNGKIYCGMYRYNTDNTGTSLLFGEFVSGAWQNKIIDGYTDEARVGMGVGMVSDSQSRLYGVWDDSPDVPIDFYGADGNVKLRYSPDGSDWDYKQQLATFSLEGYARLAVSSENLFILSLGNYTDAKLYLWAYPLPTGDPVLPEPTPGEPSGEASVNPPTFTWNSVTGAEWYQIGVLKEGETELEYFWSEGSASWTALSTFETGSYEWWVQTWNETDGYGTWSEAGSFSIPSTAASVQWGPIAPTGVVSTAYPVFSWTGLSGSEWYQIWITKDGGYHYATWVEGVTSWTPHWDMTGYPGSYEWWLQPYNSIEEGGSWSSGGSFTIGAASGPTKAVLTAPTGTVTESAPVFSWTATGATWCQVWLQKDGVYHWDEWVEGATTWSPYWNMQEYPGSYEWWVLTWGSDIYGDWSDTGNFTIASLGAATLTEPTGTVSSTPTFSWSAVTGATWYRVWLEKDGSYHWDEWIEGANTWTPSWDMTDYAGSYLWWIQGWGTPGYGEWSSSASFTME